MNKELKTKTKAMKQLLHLETETILKGGQIRAILREITTKTVPVEQECIMRV
jgi:hypothetical protein